MIVHSTLLQSDPIHGSLGEPSLSRADLTPAQQFEFDQRNKKPIHYELSDEVKDNFNSIKMAEAIVGDDMQSPDDPDQIAKNIPVVPYYFAGEEDEEEETRSTRESIRAAEKQLKKRFFINAKEERDFSKMVSEGRISAADLNFQNDIDEEVEPIEKKRERAAKE